MHPKNKFEHKKVKLAHGVKTKEHEAARAGKVRRKLQRQSIEEKDTEDELKEWLPRG